MKHLYFVRHGLSVMNQRGIFSGRTEAPLNDEGRKQATAAGRELKAVGIDCIVSSPMKRTIETAELIADEIGYSRKDIVVSDFFMERDFGPLEGTTYQPHLGNAAGVETMEALIARARKGLEFLKELPADNVLVVSHGAIGRALRHCIDPTIPYRLSKGLQNAEVVQLL